MGAIVLMLRRAPMLQVWQGAFFILALLAIGQDGAWLSQLVPDRRGLAAEIQAIDKTTRQHPGRIIAFVEDANTHHNLFYGLHGRPRMVLVDPGASVQPKAAAGYGYIVLQAGRNIRLTPITAVGQDPVVRIDAISGEGLNEDCVCVGDASTSPPITEFCGAFATSG